MTSPSLTGKEGAPASLRLTLLASALAACGLCTLPAVGAPEGGTLRAGSATIQQTGAQTRIDQSSQRAVIDWRAFGVGAGEQVLFVQPSAQSATLNRVTGEQLSVVLGRIDANGQVFLVNPNGVVFGRGAQVNVGGLVASTANVGNADFMAGRLEFREPGRAGAGVVNEGQITAAQGGLVALVAPHVRNDGVIQARLGRVTLGAGDTFALDLYGDGLVRLAVDPERTGPMLDPGGRLVTSAIAQAGRIEADGGRVVLVSAATARAALDQVINLSGTVRADAVEQQGGRIVLLARSGTTQVSGSLSAQGAGAGQAGGLVEVLGERVQLAAGARIDASGDAGGGTVRVGGGWQGSGDTMRSSTTTVAEGAGIMADARRQGRGGEVVVWSDGATSYAGSISARGGATCGDGGRVEVSGRRTLEFAGAVDAGAAAGAAGSLLLDPEVMRIGGAETAVLDRVLRTGTSTTVSAGLDIHVDAAIDGRGGAAGGGITLSAGRDINLGASIVTADGAVRLDALAGTVRFGRFGIYAGNAPITVRSGADLVTGTLVTSGAINLGSSAGSVVLDSALGATLGSVRVEAARDVRIDRPILNLRNGSRFTAVAGADVLLNAPIDGRGGGTSGGAVTLLAGGNVNLGQTIATHDGAISVTATNGTVTQAAGAQLRAGNAAIGVTAGGDLTTGSYVTSGAVGLRSTSGSVTVAESIYDSTGATTLSAAGDVVIEAGVRVENIRTGAALAVSAGRDIAVNGQIGQDRDATSATGSITLAAGRNVAINQDVVTRDAALTITAATGTVAVAAQTPGQPGRRPQVRSGNGALSVTAGADLHAGEAGAPRPNTDMPYVTTGALSLSSTAGTLFIDAAIPGTTGAIRLDGANAVQVNERIYNNGQGITITAGAGGITLNSAMLDARTVLSDIDARQGNLTLAATGDIIAPSVRSFGVLSITSSAGRIVRGQVWDSVTATGEVLGQPRQVLLSGALGIGDPTSTFVVRNAPSVEARSALGSVHLAQDAAGQRTYVQAAEDIHFSGTSAGAALIASGEGPQVELVAGRDIQLRNGVWAGVLRAHAGRDMQLLGESYLGALSAEAGRDITIGSLTSVGSVIWIQGLGTTMALRDPAAAGRQETIRGLWLDAGRDIGVYRPLHVALSATSPASEAGVRTVTMSAGGSLTLGLPSGSLASRGRLETIGDVSLSAATGNVTVTFPLGPPLLANTGGWNADQRGLNSLSIDAPGAGAVISLQGVRSMGAVSLNAPSGSVGSTPPVCTNPQACAIAALPRLASPSDPAPPVSPGPTRADEPVAAGAPGIADAPAPAAPALTEVPVSSPAAVDAGSGRARTGEGTERSALGAGARADDGAIDSEAAQAVAEGRGIVLYTGGRGPALAADLGRSGSYGTAPPPQTEQDAQRKPRRPAAKKG